MEGQSVAADVPEPRQRKAPLTRQRSVGKRRGQMAKKLVGTLKLQVPAGESKSLATRRTCIGSARY